MGRLKLIIAYDGAPFAGWQSQRHGNTIQDHLERAFATIAGDHVRVHGAGRTDAGVHALAQCAHVDVVRPRIAAEQWPAALNNYLPPTIRVMRCTNVAPTFHARFSAREKTYRYALWNGRALPPFEYQRAWHLAEPLHQSAIMNAAAEFEGEHDFAAFTARRGKRVESTVRTITNVRIRRTGARIVFDFTGNGFLYKMVRMMVGLLVQIGRGAIDRGEVRQRLANPKPRAGRQRLVAPPDGLVLVRVRY